MKAKITAEVFIDIGNRDPDMVAAEFDRGLLHQVSDFPEGEVWTARVDRIEEATADEQRLHMEE